MSTEEGLADELRWWVADHRRDSHETAGVQLLLEQGYWLGRRDFVEACIVKAEGGRRISWSAARRFLDSGPSGSPPELVTLDFAVALGEDRYQFSFMPRGHATMLLNAACVAVFGDKRL